MKEKFLPIGTVVLLNGGTKRLMITGYCSATQEASDTVYDYVACLFPEGNLAGEDVALFNHSQIQSISHMGLVDDEFNNINKEIKRLLAEEGSSTPEPPVLASFSQEDMNEFVKKVGEYNQISAPTPFDEQVIKRTLLPTEVTDNNKESDSKEVIDTPEFVDDNVNSIDDALNDGQPVLQLQPIYSDDVTGTNGGSTVTGSAAVPELTRL